MNTRTRVQRFYMVHVEKWKNIHVITYYIWIFYVQGYKFNVTVCIYGFCEVIGGRVRIRSWMIFPAIFDRIAGDFLKLYLLWEHKI